jgi:hypothetical protein
MQLVDVNEGVKKTEGDEIHFNFIKLCRELCLDLQSEKKYYV